jgi:hypothetical protein
MISRRALLAGVAIAALSQGASASLRIRGAGAGGGGGGGGVGTIQPGAGWAGNAGDVAPPAMDATQQGSGWAYPAVGLAVEPMNMWVADTSFTVTVVAGNGDPARGGIAKVRFYLEGSGAVDVTTQAIDARTGVAGFTIKPQSRTTGTPLDGDANLVYDIYPVNGFVIRRTLTLVLNTNASITRTRRFISPTGTNSGSALSSGTAWATPGYAMSTCTSGDIIECAAGTYTDTNGPTNHTVARMVEFVLAAGLNRGDVIFKKADRSTLTVYTPRSTLTKFTKIKWDMNTYVKIGFPPGTCSFVFDQCDLIDSTGVQGPATCYSYLGTDQSNNTFDPAGNNRCALLNCTATNYCMTGWTMLRNTQLNTSADAVFISNVSDVAVVNSTATQTLPMYLRQHDLASLTLTGTVTFDGTYSTLNFSGSPTFNAITTDLANCFVMVLTGSVTPWDKVAGTGTRYTFHDISAGVVRVFGDATALVAGNTVWIGLAVHGRRARLGEQLLEHHLQAIFGGRY